MANTSTKKPVNDLIKFWAEKQEKKGLEPGSRSLRKPLFPNASLPTTPLEDSFFSKTPFGDIVSSNSLPLPPTKQPHSLISDDNSTNNSNISNSTIDVQTLPKKHEERTDVNSLSQNDSSNEEASPSSAKDNYTSRPRDNDFNTRDVSNKVGPLPPTRKVTDLVSKFEKVSSPTNSVSTSPKLNPIKRNHQSFPTSPLALSPIKRNQPTPEPLSLSSSNSLTLTSKAKRRQTVPEPLIITMKQITDEPDSISSSPAQQTAPKKDYDSTTSISPISPIDHKTIPSTEKHVTEVQAQKKQSYPVQQETFPNQSLKSNNNDASSQKKVSEQNSNSPIVRSIKQSDPEPLQQQTPFKSDYLDFLTETLQTFQSSSFDITSVSPFLKSTTESDPTSLQNGNKPVSETKIQAKKLNTGSQNKTFTSRDITFKNEARYETPDLLPQPEPISPIRLDFSDFLLSSNGSSPNLNSNDKQDSEKEKEKRDFLDLINANQSDMHKIAKPEVPKKDENIPATKHMSLKGTVQLIENLKRYLQPNKFKNPNDISISTRKVASQY